MKVVVGASESVWGWPFTASIKSSFRRSNCLSLLSSVSDGAGLSSWIPSFPASRAFGVTGVRLPRAAEVSVFGPRLLVEGELGAMIAVSIC